MQARTLMEDGKDGAGLCLLEIGRNGFCFIFKNV